MELVLGLGGNLGNVVETFAWVARQITKYFPVLAASSLYLTEPVGPSQPPFLNAALLLRLDRHPLALLALCQEWEKTAGRQRELEIRWGPRPLDLDLLLVPTVVIVHPRLQLPHPWLTSRRFALLPAAEVAPSLRHPLCQKTLAELAQAVSPAEQACRRVGPFPWR